MVARVLCLKEHSGVKGVVLVVRFVEARGGVNGCGTMRGMQGRNDGRCRYWFFWQFSGCLHGDLPW